MMRQKVYRNKFLQYLEISKRNFTDILWILCAHNIIVTIRLACSVLKLSILHLMPRSDFCVLKLGLQMSENRMKNRLKNNSLDFIAKEMWHLNSLQLNPLEYHVWGTVRGLSQAPRKPNMVAELKEMLQVAAYKSGSDRKKTAKKLLKACVS